MNINEAIEVMQEWLDYTEEKRRKAERIQGLARLARTSEAGKKKAQAELRRIDQQPTVYDAARLQAAVQMAVAVLKSERF